MFKTANVFFKDSKYNYSTSVNANVSDANIVKYFKGQIFNLGNVQDNLQRCIDCIISKANLN